MMTTAEVRVAEGYVDYRLCLPSSVVVYEIIERQLPWLRSEPGYGLQGDFVALPRNWAGLYRDMVLGTGKGNRFGIKLNDRRILANSYGGTATSNIVLDRYAVPGGERLQHDALEALSTGLDGTLQLYCGAGKTVIAIEHAIRTAKPCLIVVDNNVLLEQWVEALSKHTDYRGMDRHKWASRPHVWSGRTGWARAAFTLTLYSRLADIVPTDEQRAFYGTVFYDEGHHLGSNTYSRCAGLFHGQRISLSATPTRRDGMDELVGVHLGGTLFKRLKPPFTPEVRVLQLPPTPARLEPDFSTEQSLALIGARLADDPPRVRAVTRLLQKLLRDGRRPLLLTRSLHALTNLAADLAGEPLVDTKTDEERKKRLAALLNLQPTVGALAYEIPLEKRAPLCARPILLSITRYGREGLDDPSRDTLVLHEPAVDVGLIQQMIGRILRPSATNNVRQVLILADMHPVTEAMLAKTKRALRSWPVEQGGPYTPRTESIFDYISS